MNFFPRILLAAACVVASSPSPAARLVRDINLQPMGSGEVLTDWKTIGGITYFLLPDERYGKELWRTDGTPAGTTLVKDIRPGPQEPGISSMIAVGGVLYFFANDGTNGNELWRSDGTAAGTRVVADVRAGGEDGIASSELVAAGGVLYFVGSDATSGEEIWRSDGTASGTWRLADVCPGACASNPQGIVASGSRIFFAADEPTTGIELWTSDGTVAGTHRVSDIYPGRAGSEPGRVVPTSSGVFFQARDADHGVELWFVPPDGSRAQLVADKTPGPESTQFSDLAAFGADVVFGAISTRNPNALPQDRITDHSIHRASSSGFQTLLASLPLSGIPPLPRAGFVPLGNRLLFSTSDPASPAQLWVTDGTSPGTRRLGESAALVALSYIAPDNTFGTLVGSDGFYFLGYTGPAGSDVDMWRTDGTDAGTVRVARLPQPALNTSLAQLQGRIYLAAGVDSSHGTELWTVDTGGAGAGEVADLVPGPEGSNPANFEVAGSRLFFADGSQRPWVSDGTATGTRPLMGASTFRTQGSDAQQFTPLGGRVVFHASDEAHGRELWVSDGTTAGTSLLGDIFPGPGGSVPDIIGTAGTRAFFSATDATHGQELWATDGTPAGTYLVRDINVGVASSSPGMLQAATTWNGVLYFPAADAVHGIQLWRSDGTNAGTFALTNFGAGSNICVVDLQVYNGKLVFTVCEAAGRFWWQSDGTAAGTSRITAAVIASSIQSTAVMNGVLYFAGRAPPFDTNTRGQLWRTDGTAAGTVQVTNLDPGSVFTDVSALRAMPNRILFQYCGGNTCGLASSDGTAQGTSIISPEPMGPSALVGGRLVYATIAPSGAPVLRVTDGTAAGTVNVLPPLGSNRFLGALASVQGHVIFTQYDENWGPSVWRTDGTAASTVLVADIDTGKNDERVPFDFTVVGNQMFFQAYDSRFGAEPYVIDLLLPSASDDVASVASGATVAIPVVANDGSLTSSVNPASIVVTNAPGGGSVTVSANAGTVNYTPNAGTSGVDQFSYTVADAAGRVSAAATVFVTVAQPTGSAPGTPPSTTPPGPSGPPATSGGGGGGGGGAVSVLGLLMLCGLAGATFRRRQPLQVTTQTPSIRRY